jgi:hypothetical protein
MAKKMKKLTFQQQDPETAVATQHSNADPLQRPPNKSTKWEGRPMENSHGVKKKGPQQPSVYRETNAGEKHCQLHQSQ